ncbi:MAG: hypothetical protein LUD15_06180 [Bacteroides sp.]|nr:hypothetical protein [Bacteroides sp.]
MTRAGKCINVRPCTMVGKTQYIEDDDVDFKCQECDEELEEVDENFQTSSASATSGTGGNGNKKLLLIIGTVVVLGAAGAGIYFSMNKEKIAEPEVKTTETGVVSNPVSVPDPTLISTEEEPGEEKEDEKISTPSSNELNLGYAIWKGETKGGKPHAVNGRMEFTKRYRIDPCDDKERYAEAGDYIIGEYEDGKLIQGRWYKKSGDIKAIMIGK